MKSLYKRQFMLMAGVILVSFAMLGAAFVTLSYRYAVQETRDNLGDNAKYIAQSFVRSLSNASATLGQQNDYAVNIDTLAKVSNSYVIVTETDGLISTPPTAPRGPTWRGAQCPPTWSTRLPPPEAIPAWPIWGVFSPKSALWRAPPSSSRPLTLRPGRVWW